MSTDKKERRLREKAGFTTLLVQGVPASMPDAIAARFVKMEMALRKIAGRTDEQVETSPRSIAKLDRMLALDALAGWFS